MVFGNMGNAFLSRVRECNIQEVLSSPKSSLLHCPLIPLVCDGRTLFCFLQLFFGTTHCTFSSFAPLLQPIPLSTTTCKLWCYFLANRSNASFKSFLASSSPHLTSLVLTTLTFDLDPLWSFALNQMPSFTFPFGSLALYIEKGRWIFPSLFQTA